MKTLYLDIFSGISGDMFLGALIDLGVDFWRVQASLQPLGLEGYQLHCARGAKGGNDQVPLAIEADKLGFHSVKLGDGLFFYDETSVNYPYSDSGARYWNANTAFLDPFCAISHMGALTKNIRFLVSVLKLPVRRPMMVAKQAGTTAYFCQDRLTLGVGLSPWPEDFSNNGENWDDRGPRSEEMIEILRKTLTGQMFQHKGKYYNFPKMSINPVPKQPMPIVIKDNFP